MNSEPGTSINQCSTLENLGNQVFTEWQNSHENRTPGAPGLMMLNRHVPAPEFGKFSDNVDGPVLRQISSPDSTRICWGEIPVVLSSSRQLPVQTASLGLVMLSHIIGNGKEPELEEACRVLQPGGVLLILGLNRIGFRHFRDRAITNVPGLRPLAVRERLEHFDMNIRCSLAAGFMKRQWPADLNRGLARILVPIADLLLIVARKEEPRLATPIKRTQLRTVSAPSALAGP